GYTFVPLRDVVAWAASPSAQLPNKALTITADDGHRSISEPLSPIVMRDRLHGPLCTYPSANSNASYAMREDKLRASPATGRSACETQKG
ncbi:polysaccharide deacetylase, partial [Burkholderia pseudomallei]